MKKNLLSLLLVAAMVFALLAGCGDTATSSQAAAPSDTESVATQTPDAAPVQEASTPEEPVSVADDRDVPEITYPLVDEPTTLTYWQAWPPFLNEISAPSDAAMFAQLEEATGVKLEITAVSTETSADDFMLRCASMDLTDMVQKGGQSYTGGGAKAIEDEVLLDLLPLLEEYSVNYWRIMNSDPNIYKNVLNDEGQVPELIGMYTEPYYTDQGFWIRTDLLEKTGKDIPTTIGQLDEVLEAFKTLGLTDPLVVLSEGNCEFISRAYGAVDKMDGDTLVPAARSDAYKEYLKKMHEYYEKGYINVDFVTYTESDTKPPQDVIYSDNGGIFNEDVASIAGYYTSTTNPDFEVAPIAQVRLNEDDVLDFGYLGVVAADKYSLSLSATCSDPKLCIQYMDYLFSDAGFELANYGTEGVTYTKEGDTYQFTDLILNNEQGFDWQLCQSLYINPGFPCLNDLSVQEMTYNEAQKAAVPTWVGAYDSSDATTPNSLWLSYTTEESEERAAVQTDIETYQEEMRLKFITGQADIDEQWDTYVETLTSMGIDTLEETNQNAITRYNAK